MANCVIIGSNSSGGGETVNTFTRSEWNAMTFDEKVSSSPAVIDNQYYYDYSTAISQPVFFLPNSTEESVVTLATEDNYIVDSLTWGDGSIPVTLTTAAKFGDKCIHILGSKDSNIAAVIPSTGYYTVYVVAQKYSTKGIYPPIISLASSATSDYDGIFYLTDGLGIDSNLSVAFYPIEGYEDVVAAIKEIPGQHIAYTNSTVTEAYYNNSGSPANYVSIGSAPQNRSGCDIGVKFIGVVIGEETDEQVQGNIANLRKIYSI